MKKRGKNFLIEQYKKSWKYLKECDNYFAIIILIFFMFVLVGFFFPAPESISNQILQFIQELIEKTAGMSGGELISFIFWNNLKSSLYGMVFGIILGTLSILITIINGYILGFVAIRVAKIQGLPTLLLLLPHGIFELPAVFISLGLGLKLGTFIFQKNIKKSLKNYFVNSIRIFIFIVIPLLIVAAIIEGGLMGLFT